MLQGKRRKIDKSCQTSPDRVKAGQCGVTVSPSFLRLCCVCVFVWLKHWKPFAFHAIWENIFLLGDNRAFWFPDPERGWSILHKKPKRSIWDSFWHIYCRFLMTLNGWESVCPSRLFLNNDRNTQTEFDKWYLGITFFFFFFVMWIEWENCLEVSQDCVVVYWTPCLLQSIG